MASFAVRSTIDLLDQAAKVLENLRRLLAGLRVRALDLEDRRWAASAFGLESCQTAGAADRVRSGKCRIETFHTSSIRARCCDTAYLDVCQNGRFSRRPGNLTVSDLPGSLRGSASERLVHELKARGASMGVRWAMLRLWGCRPGLHHHKPLRGFSQSQYVQLRG